MKRTLTLFLYVVFNISVFMRAQLPLSDATWSLTQQDAFNTNTLSPQWITTYPWGAPVNNGDEYNSASNLLLTYSTGYLAIKCETVTPITYTAGPNSPYKYQSGVISSTWTAKYGYYEISAKLPVGMGYWPAFWIWGMGDTPYCWYNEIDIVENGGLVSSLGNQMGFNYWYYPSPVSPPCPALPSCPGGSVIPPGIDVGTNIANEHKYAVFWEPDRFTYFFDDSPVFSVDNDPAHVPSHSLSTIINFAIIPSNWLNPPDPNTVFPAYFQVNYFNLWQLTPDCSTVENICNFSAGSYTYAVKKSVTIGGSSCTSTINTGSNVSFWATDFVLLNEGTTINDNGSGSFLMRVTECPN
ncbi:MAG: glycoside hydrolase family 16 protein [Bacteroidia bacterium]|nr:glycoside hydrolase family 16 protein [Bacteroidia bacterium]